MRDPFINALVIFVIVLAFVFGWVFAHNSIATQCEKLERFYVGSDVYECKVKK